ncbi:uncharacterized protein [Macrobrachium rosenbergii]|uniref:uncharacterized protein n=1 Tax=Macrobrachium rosenbergii TaxID=79674 RepID=UPI0034D645AE
MYFNQNNSNFQGPNNNSNFQGPNNNSNFQANSKANSNFQVKNQPKSNPSGNFVNRNFAKTDNAHSSRTITSGVGSSRTCYWCNKVGHTQAKCFARQSYLQRQATSPIALVNQVKASQHSIENEENGNKEKGRNLLMGGEDLHLDPVQVDVAVGRLESVGSSDSSKVVRAWNRADFIRAQHDEFDVEITEGDDVSKPCFVSERGLLCRLSRSALMESSEYHKQILVPKQFRDELLQSAHEDPFSGHFGVTKTFKRLTKLFWWPNMRRCIKQFLRTCETCQVMGKPNQVLCKAPLKPIPAIGEPFSEIVIDVVGPLPRTQSGYMYLLTVMDRASRFPEAFPLRKVTSKAVWEKLVEYFCRYGLPCTIQSDRGTNFTSKYFQDRCAELAIQHITSVPYHPESQGVVERFHQTLKSIIEVFRETPGLTSWLEHDVEVGDARPVKQAPYRLNPEKAKVVEKEVQYMLDHDLIQPSSSPWSSPIVLVLRKAGLVVNIKKCEFGKAVVTYLGHEVGLGKVAPKHANIEVIANLPQPCNVRGVRKILGMLGYYRRFVKNFADIAQPLTNLLKKNTKFLWSTECEKAFNKLKSVLVSEPILSSPNFNKPFVLAVDASDVGIGGVLFQRDDKGEMHPVSYFSKKLLPAERKYSTIEKEALALVKSVSHFSIYLSSSLQVEVLTDHNPLVFINKMKGANQRILRWALLLQEYNLVFQHIKGVDNKIPDALSRM